MIEVAVLVHRAGGVHIMNNKRWFAETPDGHAAR